MKWDEIKAIAAKASSEDYYFNLMFTKGDRISFQEKEDHAQAILIILSSFDKIAAVVDAAIEWKKVTFKSDEELHKALEALEK